MAMYNLFNSKSNIRATSYAFPLFDYVRRILLRDINKLLRYRRLNSKAVRSDHLLVRTLQSFNIPYKGNIEIYRGQIETRTNQISGNLGYTSTFQRGKVFFGKNANFYGNKTVEIVIATSDDFDLTDADINWPTWRPIRVLAHPRSDINIEVIDGTNTFSESGLAVLEINLPMLACQYQLWKESRNTDDALQDVAQFVTAYPLTNAIYSHLDVAIFNRMSKLLFKEPYGTSKVAVPFFTTDSTSFLDKYLKDIIGRFTKTSLTWEDALRNMPSLIDDDMLNVHRLPKMPMSQQVIWAAVAARLNVVSFLVKLRDVGKHHTSVNDVIILRRSLITLETGKLLSSGLPSTVSEYFEKFIQNRIEHFL
jgi:hypothetical protein